LNRAKGLQNNTVLDLFCDNNLNLWLGLDNGIDYIETNSPLSYFTYRKEIGAGYASIVFGGKIYLGTNQGLYCRKWNPDFDSNEPLQKVENSQGQVWSLSVVNQSLFCGHDKGTFEISGDKAVSVSSINGGWMFFEMPGHPDKVLEGCYDGLLLYDKKPGKGLQFRTKVKNFAESSRTIEVENDSVLWMSHGYKGIFRLVLNTQLDSVVSIRYYGKEQGFPSIFGINVMRFEGKIFFASPKGYFRYNPQTDRVEEDPELGKIFGGQNGLTRIIPDGANSYWFSLNGEIGILLKHYQGNYSIDCTQFKQMKGTINQTFESILPIDNHNVIISNEEGFIHFDPSFQKDYQIPFYCLIREIVTKGDSVIFGGNYVDGGKLSAFRPKKQIAYLPYNLNDLHFNFSATVFDNVEKVTYSYKLVGYQDEWSDWSPKSEKEFTNLSEGSYIFQVKARNIYGVESQVVTWEFVIKPPWYRSVWAYIVYVLLGAYFTVLGLMRIIRHFEKEKEYLRIAQQREMTRKEQEYMRESLQNQQEIDKLRNEKLQIEIELQRDEVEKKKKELASMAASITRKNEILNTIKKMLEGVSSTMKMEERKKISNIVKSIDKDMNFDEDWAAFEQHFDQVHGDFIKRLKTTYPSLTPTDLKLCAYLKMNISTKEIAPLLNISIRGVEISRYRLRKKLNLEANENLVEFMLKF
jgi:DNA-binding CsgD family transcriptional regulator